MAAGGTSFAERRPGFAALLTSAACPCMKPDISKPELMSIDEVSSSPKVVSICTGESEESKIHYLSLNCLPTPPSEHMTLDGTHTSVGASPKKYVTGASCIGLVVSKEPDEDSEMISAREMASTETEPTLNDSTTRIRSPGQGNSSNMSNFGVTNKERVRELKLLASHNPYPCETQVLQKSAPLESGLESLDGSYICEIEGESIVDRLKRQIEYDKKCINALYKELEEERNAATIAANEAMAMITRLQEEKAALYMEALQYLRISEEQAEYDGDALNKVNDLLAEKEKEMQDLEAELEWYKEKLIDEPMIQSMHKEIYDLIGDNVITENVSVPHYMNPMKMSPNDTITEVLKVSDEAVTSETSSSLEFEEEKLYISQCLKIIDKKLHQLHCDGKPETLEDNKLNQHEYSNGEEPQSDDQIEETVFSVEKNSTNESLTDLPSSVASDSDDCSPSNENNHSTSVGPESSFPRRKVDSVSLENEISDLNDWLEALESDHDLLEHILNSLPITKCKKWTTIYSGCN